MKFISYINKEGNLRIINLNQIIKCEITSFRISIILNSDVDIEINSESDSDLFASLSGFFSSELEDHYRIYNATPDKYNRKEKKMEQEVRTYSELIDAITKDVKDLINTTSLEDALHNGRTRALIAEFVGYRHVELREKEKQEKIK